MDGEIVCLAEQVPDEVCNGRDDDCDDEIDEGGPCIDHFLNHCTVWSGWKSVDFQPRFEEHPPASADWGRCPDEPNDLESARQSCVSTDSRGQYRGFPVRSFVFGTDDYLAVALTCDTDDPLAQWMQASCSVYLGQMDTGFRETPAREWGPCPMENAGRRGNLTCVSSAGDGLFHSMRIIGGADITDLFAVAFRCESTGPVPPSIINANRVASTLQDGIEFSLGWSREATVDALRGQDEWPHPCLDNEVTPRLPSPPGNCVSSAGDGLFHASWWGNTFGQGEQPITLGIALRAR